MPKTKFSAVVSTFVLCYGFWILLTWSFDPQELIAGAVVSFFVALFSSRIFIHENGAWLFNPKRFFALIAYGFVFLGELWKANCDVARRCYGGCKDIYPGIVKIPTKLKSLYGESMLANSITLTPGTITLDIASENATGDTYFYVHCIDVTEFEQKELVYDDHTGKEKTLAYSVGDKASEAIKGRMERWIRRIWE